MTRRNRLMGTQRTLALSTITNFDDEVLSSSTYKVLDAAVPLTGAFAIVASGARVNTADDRGSFRVNYGASAATGQGDPEQRPRGERTGRKS